MGLVVYARDLGDRRSVSRGLATFQATLTKLIYPTVRKILWSAGRVYDGSKMQRDFTRRKI